MANIDIIAAFLFSKGLNQSQVDGILGNLETESEFSPTANNSGEGAIGIAQWEGSRRSALQSYAAANGMQETDLRAQLGFLWQELQGYGGMLQQMRNVSAAQAAAIFDQQYERSSGSSRDVRMNSAADLQQTGRVNADAGKNYLTVPGGTGFNEPGGGGGGGGNAGFNGVGMPNPTASDFQQAEGALGGLLTSIPELAQKLQQAVSQGWSVTKFQQAIEQTHWYRQHSDTARQAIALRASDPATYDQNFNNTRERLATSAVQLGVMMSGGQLNSLTLRSIMEGWDSGQIQQHIASMWLGGWESHHGQYTGQAAQMRDQVDQIANDYGVPFTNGGQQRWVAGMLTGQITPEQYKAHAIQQAQSIYRGVAGQINENTTLKTIADPYVATMSNLLELDPGSINYSNPLVKQALQGAAIGVNTMKGNKPDDYTATPLWQFEQQVRADPRWGQTQNARDTMSTALVKIGADFGFGPNG